MSLILRGYEIAGFTAGPYLRRMLAQRAVRGKEIPARLDERFGISSLPRPPGKLIWIHAASVGETMSVLPVIAALAGHAEVLLTTGTITSAKLAAERLPAHARHQFVPLDVPHWIEKFLVHWRPDCAVFVENEIWPTTLRLLDSRFIPRLLINASFSTRSVGNWKRLPGLAKLLLGGFRWVHAQSDQDAQNLKALGAANILCWGNLKFAAPLLPVDEPVLAAMRAAIPGKLWLAASTHPGEEDIVTAAHSTLCTEFTDLVTIIAPRHPERGREFSCPRRSLGEKPRAGEVYIADTLGELGLFYRLSPFAFIGGSLVNIGGHNIAEAAQLGIPVIVGKFTHEIPEQVEKLLACNAIKHVSGAASLAVAAGDWLRDPEAAQAAGEAAAKSFAGLESLPQKIADLIMAASL